MFIHITKDFKKKLDDIDARLEQSLDKDEIQTLGLKLRFYQNELHHYQALLSELKRRTAEIQQKYGFLTDDTAFVPLMTPGPAPEKRPATLEGETSESPLTATVETLPETLAAPTETAAGPGDSDPIGPGPEAETVSFISQVPEETTAAEMEEDASPESLLESWLKALHAGGDPEPVCGRIAAAAEKDRMKLSLWVEETAAAGSDDDPSGLTDLCIGALAAALGRHGTAINLLEISLRKGVEYPAATRLLADALFQKGLYDRALTHYTLALKMEPERPDLVLGAARCWLRTKQPEKADDALRGAQFSREADRTEAQLLRAEAHLALKHFTTAAEMAEDCLRAASGAALRSRCWLLLAHVKEMRQDVLSAIDLYEKSLEQDPENPEANFGLGRLYFQHKAIPLARKQLNVLIRSFPESEWADRARELLYREGPDA